MKAIGGYFELEISNRGSLFHDRAVALNTGRNAFEYILLCNEIKHIYMPYFTCDVLFQPLDRNNISFTFYHVDESLMPVIPNISQNDFVLYTNYYGLAQKNIETLSGKYRNLILDNAQAYFDRPHKGISTFYSPRKFFGLADGGFAYSSANLDTNSFPQDSSINRIRHLVKRIDYDAEFGYEDYKKAEEGLNNLPIMKMSRLTQQLLRGINYKEIIKKRITNFNFLHNKLRGFNNFSNFIDTNTFTCPLTYPFWIDRGNELRTELMKNKIYTAQYWPNVMRWINKKKLEYELSFNVVSLPIDQRLAQDDMLYIIERIFKWIRK